MNAIIQTVKQDIQTLDGQIQTLSAQIRLLNDQKEQKQKELWTLEHALVVNIVSQTEELLFVGGGILDSQRRFALTSIGGSLAEPDPSRSWELVPHLNKPNQFKIRHICTREFLYCGSRTLDASRRHVLTWIGDHNEDPAMIWEILPQYSNYYPQRSDEGIVFSLPFYKIRHLQSGEYLYAGSNVFSPTERFALTWIGDIGDGPNALWRLKTTSRGTDEGLGKTAMEWLHIRSLYDQVGRSLMTAIVSGDLHACRSLLKNNFAHDDLINSKPFLREDGFAALDQYVPDGDTERMSWWLGATPLMLAEILGQADIGRLASCGRVAGGSAGAVRAASRAASRRGRLGGQARR